jgi:hypothetical protein
MQGCVHGTAAFRAEIKSQIISGLGHGYSDENEFLMT